MSDTNPGQDPNPSGQGPQGAGTGTGAGTGQGPTGRTAEQYEADLKALRNEAADWRTKLRAAETRLAEIDNASKTEAEKAAAAADAATKRADAAEAKIRELTARTAIMTEAQRLGIVDPDAAYRLIDSGAIKTDASGAVTNAAELLGDLAKARPYLLGGSGSPGNAGSGRTKLTAADVRKMSQAEINARWEEVQAALSAA